MAWRVIPIALSPPETPGSGHRRAPGSREGLSGLRGPPHHHHTTTMRNAFNHHKSLHGSGSRSCGSGSGSLSVAYTMLDPPRRRGRPALGTGEQLQQQQEQQQHSTAPASRPASPARRGPAPAWYADRNGPAARHHALAALALVSCTPRARDSPRGRMGRGPTWRPSRYVGVDVPSIAGKSRRKLAKS